MKVDFLGLFFRSLSTSWYPRIPFMGYYSLTAFIMVIVFVDDSILISLLTSPMVCRGIYLNNRMEKRALLSEPPPTITSIEVPQSVRPLIKEIQSIPKRVKKLIEKLPHQEVCCSFLPLCVILWSPSYVQ